MYVKGFPDPDVVLYERERDTAQRREATAQLLTRHQIEALDVISGTRSLIVAAYCKSKKLAGCLAHNVSWCSIAELPISG